jgi:phosphoserine aminotransferase
MRRVWNFSAGPGVLPEPVLREAADEMLSWHDSGMSVMEMSHRGSEFMRIAAEAEADLRALLAIPSHYRVLFLQGGATLQFAMVPINLLRGRAGADYVHTGEWAKKAIAEAKKFGRVRLAASAEDRSFTYAPAQSQWRIDPEAAYLHYTSNETIGGVEFHWVPDTGPVPLVCDMSSQILSRPLDVSRYGLIYAGAQKNIGPSGLTVVIVREDLLGAAPPDTPSMLDYRALADSGSMLNTPPCYAIYIAGLVFRWLAENGGLVTAEQRAIERSRLVYELLDASGFYRSPVERADRSRMNIPFTLHDAALDEPFLREARAAGLEQLRGHRSVGGMRASLYNAMPVEGARALVEFMREFERRHG